MRPKSRLLARVPRFAYFFSGLPADNCGYFAGSGSSQAELGGAATQYLAAFVWKAPAPLPTRVEAVLPEYAPGGDCAYPDHRNIRLAQKKTLEPAAQGRFGRQKRPPARHHPADKAEEPAEARKDAISLPAPKMSAAQAQTHQTGGKTTAVANRPRNAPLGRHAEFQEKHLPFKPGAPDRQGMGMGACFPEARRGKGGYGRHLSGAGQPGSSHRQHCWTTAWPIS